MTTTDAATNPVGLKLPLTDWKRIIWCFAHKVEGMMSVMASPSARNVTSESMRQAADGLFLTSWSLMSERRITDGMRLTNNSGENMKDEMIDADFEVVDDIPDCIYCHLEATHVITFKGAHLTGQRYTCTPCLEQGKVAPAGMTLVSVEEVTHGTK